ncbi:ABC transporter transmembrane domain containing protein [Sarcoptes scabiei]|uniref:ABC transporter transmembrane domain containing protein n=1 Tax=Sarcoptes scabiei TaxID=52283 RepID=A0A132A7A7_SARSC|nr:ABC transporter transmembrane domain containing protein [Sarcoptes scabiei]
MDIAQIIRKQSKFEKSNIFSRIYSTWMLGLFFKGLRKDIEIDDLCKGPSSDDSKRLCDKLERLWNEELKRKKPNFTRATAKTFGGLMASSFALFFFEEIFIRNIQPLMLAKMINFFVRKDPDQYLWACLNAAGVVMTSFIYILCHHPACYNAAHVSTKVRVAWCTLMYKKALRLHNSAFNHTTVGQILNLMSNDVSRLDEFFIIGCYMIVAPLQTIIGIYVCYLYIGNYSFIGFVILILFIPFNSFNGRLFQKIRTKTAHLGDRRIQIISEIIKGMRVIKMYAWEKHFSRLVSEARR